MTTFISGQRCFFDLHYTVNNDDLAVNKQFRMILKSLTPGIIFSKQEFSVTDSGQQETFAVYVDIPDSVQAQEITVVVILEEFKNDVWIRVCYQSEVIEPPDYLLPSNLKGLQGAFFYMEVK